MPFWHRSRIWKSKGGRACASSQAARCPRPSPQEAGAHQSFSEHGGKSGTEGKEDFTPVAPTLHWVGCHQVMAAAPCSLVQ